MHYACMHVFSMQQYKTSQHFVLKLSSNLCISFDVFDVRNSKMVLRRIY